MPYSLEEFRRDAHETLRADPGAAGREKVRRLVERLLANAEFVASHLGPDSPPGRRELYHDSETDIHVLAHGSNETDRVGKPHDHGASWAIYGQAVGVTNMTVWRRLDDGREDGHAELEVAREFTLDPGVVALFEPGVIHSTAHPYPARWLRVTGTDLDSIRRHRFDPDARTVSLMTADA